MDRDDLILRAIAEGATTSAEVANRAGLTPASVWRGLRHLIRAGQVFSPTWAVYRLTASGKRVLAMPEREPSAAPEGTDELAGQRSAAVSAIGVPDPQSSSSRVVAAAELGAHPESGDLPGSLAPTEGQPMVPTWLRRLGLGALAVGSVALLYLVARPSASTPPEAPAPQPQPLGWPYTGWPGAGLYTGWPGAGSYTGWPGAGL